MAASCVFPLMGWCSVMCFDCSADGPDDLVGPTRRSGYDAIADFSDWAASPLAVPTV